MSESDDDLTIPPFLRRGPDDPGHKRRMENERRAAEAKERLARELGPARPPQIPDRSKVKKQVKEELETRRRRVAEIVREGYYKNIDRERKEAEWAEADKRARKKSAGRRSGRTSWSVEDLKSLGYHMDPDTGHWKKKQDEQVLDRATRRLFDEDLIDEARNARNARSRWRSSASRRKRPITLSKVSADEKKDK